MLLKEISDSQKITQTLRHLLVIDKKETRMHPNTDKRFLTRSRLLLSNLCFVMRKLQINTASVNIILRSVKMFRNSGVFNMPSRSSLPKAGVPRGFTGFVKFP